jgi:hypothetical protein
LIPPPNPGDAIFLRPVARPAIHLDAAAFGAEKKP